MTLQNEMVWGAERVFFLTNAQNIYTHKQECTFWDACIGLKSNREMPCEFLLWMTKLSAEPN